mgnify:CR=1 FL=1
MKTVIVGGVAGGASCAARLRRLDETAEIILLERGAYISYANCGLPYHVGGVIRERSSLLLQTPEQMQRKYHIDVRVKNEVTAINRGKKTVTVKKLETGEMYEESYDKLVLSTGSSPVRPPIPGIDSPRIRTLWTVPDADQIRNMALQSGSGNAAVIGGGFIGLETAENLQHAGLKVSIIEMQNQVMMPLDFEMAQLLHENISENGVDLYLGDGVDAFQDTGTGLTIRLKSGHTVQADFAVLSIGVKPNGELAKAAGLQTNARGGILVNDHLVTSDPNVYAVGDVIAVRDFQFGDSTMIPLAGPANKQGRIAANNLAGLEDTYSGTQGSSVAKVFDLTVATTGANEKVLRKRGMQKDKDYRSLLITQNSHAGYYPGAVPMTLKLLFSMDGSRIFGAQIVGREGVDKRIDTIGTTIRLGGGVLDLKQLELAYAPPYSSAKDPVNMAGFTAENVIKGLVRFADWDAPEKTPDALLLDVREDAEVMAYSIPGAVHIPLGELRSRLNELDRNKPIIVFCAIGVRAYNAVRILMQHDFPDVRLYPGGSRFYQSVRYQPQKKQPEPAETHRQVPAAGKSGKFQSIRLDCSGMQCPGPIMKVFEPMKTMQSGDQVEISASDPGFMHDIESWCRRTGNTLLSREKRANEFVALVQKGMRQGAESTAPVTPAAVPDGKTIIVFSNNLDKVLASFIIANGAAAMGRKVTMFFTFWGLTVLRKPEKQSVQKSFVESMFGTMLPRGSKKLKLSQMNLSGMGTKMMKRIMQEKNVSSLEDLIQKAIHNGVRIVACTMSMDVMGIHKEELIDGVELGGVGTYLGDAEESNVNLFI